MAAVRRDLSDRWYGNCAVCPHLCGVDRFSGAEGVCGTDAGIYVAAAQLHRGEEPVLVGRGGSGTIFFSSCNLRCVFCQNYDISMCAHAEDGGRELPEGGLGGMMWELKLRGAENINLVSPTHMGPAIFDEVAAVRAEGMRLPVVYNCGGYESVEFLRDLEGLVDIYMPDIKFGSDKSAAEVTTATDYFSRCTEAVREMHRQVGNLSIGPRGTADRGLLVRHLVMPGETAQEDSRRVLDFIADEISPHTYVNLMDQYRPAYRARSYRELGRRVTLEEFDRLRRYASQRGLYRGAQ
jgi:putative pyruvate formate lyase activating enzyme